MKKPVYLDYHATTPVDPRVFSAMEPYFMEEFGNSHSSTHCYGWKSEQAIETAREEIAASLGAQSSEIVFTSGATEGNNLAILGAARANREKGNHLITSATEHKAVLDCMRELEAEGFNVTILPVDEYGQVRLTDLKSALRQETILVSIMAANNEIGTINRIRELAAAARTVGAIFHTDAVQAFGRVSLDVEKDQIDLLSLSGHKIYGPKGVGALYVRRRNPRVTLKPLIFGGGHERGLRSGTLNTPGIVGLGKAAAIAVAEAETENQRLASFRDYLWDGLIKEIPDLILNGHPQERLAHNLNFSIPMIAAESLLSSLKEIAVSSGSACQSGKDDASHVLSALGRPPELARASLRFGLGRFTTQADVDFAREKVYTVIKKLRSLNPLYQLKNGPQEAR